MKLKTYVLAALTLLLLSGLTECASQPNYKITEEKLREHVTFLCSDFLEGRLTGSRGEKRATRYIASAFSDLKLEPAGDKGTFFQNFNFVEGVSLGKNNSLIVEDPKGIMNSFILNKEWRPLSFSDSHRFNIKDIIFAGYGITTPTTRQQTTYDSYYRLNVKNKWVVLFENLPKNLPKKQRNLLSQYASLRYKTFVAKEHGAKGVIFLSDSRDTLIPLSSDLTLSSSGIIVLSVKYDLLDDLLGQRGHLLNSVQKIKNAYDSGQLSSIPVLNNINIIGQTDIIKNVKQGRNVLAKLRVKSNAKQMIIVGAHIDHLGRGQLNGSRADNNEKGMIHPGADDNASGVSSIIEAAIKLSDMKAKDMLNGNKDILFAAWSGEEIGVLGSTYFINQITSLSLHPSIDAAINLDMVGHLREKLVLQGVGSSMDWLKIIRKIQINRPFDLITQNDPYLPTDSTPFYLHDVPIINFFTGAHDDYHRPGDKPETLNYTGIKDVTDFLTDLILTLEDQPNTMRFRSVAKTKHHAKRTFKIYLGTIPDYTSADVSGVMLSGVAKDSPAERAGLARGDIITNLAGKKIHDLYDYSFAFNSLLIGKPINMLVVRGNKTVVLTITPQASS